jgi:D-alanyl-D-alanine carboxypeptidase (penicillin-binding protein 5/6)
MWRALWSGLLLWAAASAAWAQPSPVPVAASAYLVKADGATLWEKAADAHLPPASLTKIMTALLVLEHYDPRAVVTVSPGAAAETGSRIGLRKGERMTLENLLAATLIQSANDACHALADHAAGSEARFVERMNRRAREWGLRDTRFANACGHDRAGHYSSARDLAALAERALRQPVFARLMAVVTLDIATADGRRRFSLENHNALIGRYPGALGVKTGYTQRAGKCLVALARRDGRNVLLVLLNAPNRWWDAVDMLDRAFSDAA